MNDKIICKIVLKPAGSHSTKYLIHFQKNTKNELYNTFNPSTSQAQYVLNTTYIEIVP
jgi:hypothetical protein